MPNPVAELRAIAEHDREHPCSCEVCKVAGDDRYVALTYRQMRALLQWCEDAEKRAKA